MANEAEPMRRGLQIKLRAGGCYFGASLRRDLTPDLAPDLTPGVRLQFNTLPKICKMLFFAS